MYLSYKDCAAILDVLGKNTKKDVRLVVHEEGKSFNLNTSWSGGSLNEYWVISRQDFQILKAKSDLGNPFTQPERIFILRNGQVLVEHKIFRGKSLGFTIHATKEDVKYLPSPSNSPIELSIIEKLVLVSMSQYRASYAGKNRYEQTLDELRWAFYQDPEKQATVYEDYTKEKYEEARKSLASKGLLRGKTQFSLNTAGKNVASELPGIKDLFKEY